MVIFKLLSCGTGNLKPGGSLFPLTSIFPPCWNFLPLKDAQCQLVRDQVRIVGARKLQVKHLEEKSLAGALETKQK